MPVLRVWIVIALFSTNVTTASAQVPRIPRTAACETKLITTNPFFYRLERDGKISYLLGTVHLGVPLGAFSAHVRRVISSCSDLTFETSHPTGLMKTIKTAGDLAMFPNPFGPRLSRRLSREDWSTYVARLEANGIPVAIADYLSPFAANMLASPNFNVMLAGLNAGTLDQELGEVAVAAGKPIRGLESHRAQRRMMARIFSLENLVEQLRQPGAHPEKVDLVDSYLQGDPAPTVAKNEKFRTEEPEFYDFGMLARNRAWIPRIEARHAKEGVTLFAVGTAHLFGDAVADEGVLNLLRERGFRVTRVVD